MPKIYQPITPKILADLKSLMKEHKIKQRDLVTSLGKSKQQISRAIKTESNPGLTWEIVSYVEVFIGEKFT